MNIGELQKKYNSLDHLDLELLIAKSIHKPKNFILIHPEHKLSFLEKISLIYFIYLRKKGYSVATIIGHKEFYGLDFFVNKKVLVPRPETELMVEEVIQEITNYKLQITNKIILIDVGTGSGCIPISILKNIKKPIQTFAIDISRPALRIAKKKAKKHGVKINFLYSNLLEPILKKYPSLPTPHTLLITANLPYITEEQYQNEPSIQQEPKNALVADKQGLALYEELLQQIKLLNPTFHFPVSIFLEIDPSQTKAISNLIQQILPKANFEIKKDLAGLDRLVKITKN
jgi:release factor glutamine methyltransferase